MNIQEKERRLTKLVGFIFPWTIDMSAEQKKECPVRLTNVCGKMFCHAINKLAPGKHEKQMKINNFWLPFLSKNHQDRKNRTNRTLFVQCFDDQMQVTMSVSVFVLCALCVVCVVQREEVGRNRSLRGNYGSLMVGGSLRCVSTAAFNYDITSSMFRSLAFILENTVGWLILLWSVVYFSLFLSHFLFLFTLFIYKKIRFYINLIYLASFLFLLLSLFILKIIPISYKFNIFDLTSYVLITRMLLLTKSNNNSYNFNMYCP